jgi:cystathionine gamma-synthase
MSDWLRPANARPSPSRMDQVRTFHHIMGGVVDPHAGYLLLRGLKTLDLRVARHNTSAMTLARRLEGHPKVKWAGKAV